MVFIVSKYKRVFYFPFKSPQNSYLELMQGAWSNLGFEIADVRDIWRLKSMRNHSGSIVVLNWFEENVARKSENSLLAWPLFVLKFRMLKLFGLKIICVRHNRRPVDEVSKQHIKVFNKAVKYLEDQSDAVIMHSEIEAHKLGVNYVPHPMYPIVDAKNNTSEKQQHHLVFGKIKRYKQVDKLLTVWPLNIPLLVAGEIEDESYAGELKALCDRRGLDVQFDLQRISDDKLNRYFESSKTVVIPYVDSCCIASGALIHALSAGLPIVTLKSDFSLSLKNTGLNIYFFEDKETLLKTLNSMSDLQLEKQDPDLLSELLGKLAVKKSLQKVLNQLNVDIHQNGNKTC